MNRWMGGWFTYLLDDLGLNQLKHLKDALVHVSREELFSQGVFAVGVLKIQLCVGKVGENDG